eukprot:8141986-Pyramimonas_sp.AAC.1
MELCGCGKKINYTMLCHSLKHQKGTRRDSAGFAASVDAHQGNDAVSPISRDAPTWDVPSAL